VLISLQDLYNGCRIVVHTLEGIAGVLEFSSWSIVNASNSSTKQKHVFLSLACIQTQFNVGNWALVTGNDAMVHFESSSFQNLHKLNRQIQPSH